MSRTGRACLLLGICEWRVSGRTLKRSNVRPRSVQARTRAILAGQRAIADTFKGKPSVARRQSLGRDQSARCRLGALGSADASHDVTRPCPAVCDGGRSDPGHRGVLAPGTTESSPVRLFIGAAAMGHGMRRWRVGRSRMRRRMRRGRMRCGRMWRHRMGCRGMGRGVRRCGMDHRMRGRRLVRWWRRLLGRVDRMPAVRAAGARSLVGIDCVRRRRGGFGVLAGGSAWRPRPLYRRRCA
jgi:hypothetical protein